MPTVVRNDPAGTQLRRLTFDEVPSTYTRPGQYLLAPMGVDELKPGFFAVASSPGQPLELLIKNQGAAAEVLCALEVGAAIETSDVQGPGFPMERTADRELVLLVAGSGISAARPVIQAEVDAGLPRAVTLFYGVLTPEHRSFVADLEAWAAAGVGVELVYGETFVQHAARDLGFCRADVSVVLVGHRAMVEEATGMWTAEGCPEEQLLLNF